MNSLVNSEGKQREISSSVSNPVLQSIGGEWVISSRSHPQRRENSNCTTQWWGTGNIFGWIMRPWRPSNHWDKWYTCPPMASITRAEERAGQDHLGDSKTPWTKLHGLSPQANYTDRATAACQWSDCQLVRIEGATWSAWRIPPAIFSVF
jgi:hypothetical protein